MPTTRVVPMAHIVPPPDPLRVSMDDQPMEQLKRSIEQIGLLYPLLVLAKYRDADDNLVDKPIKGRHKNAEDVDAYEIIDGHRRYTALQLLHAPTATVTICEGVEQAKFAMMLDANVCREDVTPFEEGVQFLDLATKHTWSMDDLMRTFNKSEDYINDRIDIVRRDQRVAEAVRDRKIGLGHAKEILKCQDEAFRPVLLDQAVTHGATIAGLREMRHNFAREQSTAQGDLPMNASPQFVPGAVIPLEECIWCGSSENPESLVSVKVHQYHQLDLKAVLEKFSLRALLGKVEGAS
jgi:ParB/RepB/Spo0J family partition protein